MELAIAFAGPGSMTPPLPGAQPDPVSTVDGFTPLIWIIDADPWETIIALIDKYGDDVIVGTKTYQPETYFLTVYDDYLE
jgi:hypothetical protein